MGGTYSNVSVRTTDLDLIRGVLASFPRNARVVVENGWSVVCDQQSDLFYEPIEPLGAALSAATGGPAVAAFSFDGDTLGLWVFAGGEAVTAYEHDGEEATGDADALRAALKPDADAEALRAALFDPDEDAWPVERHARVAALLGLPDAAAGYTWSYLEEDDAPAYTEIATFDAPVPPLQAYGALLASREQPFTIRYATEADAAVMPGFITPGEPIYELPPFPGTFPES